MSQKSFNVNINNKVRPFKKSIKVDSDKSISIRSFLIGSISQNVSVAENVLESEDVLSTIKCLKKLGVKIKRSGERKFSIYGKGLGSLSAKKNTTLNFGNSGTLARLLIGMLTTTPNININVKGDNSLNKRSMKKLIELMSKFGGIFLPKKKCKFTLKIISSKMPIGINYEAGVSAQLKSAVILAGLNASGNTIIIEKSFSRNHTENILSKNNNVIKIKGNRKKIIEVVSRRNLNPIKINVPGDPSSAAFFTALTLMNKNSKLKIRNVGLNPTRIGFYKLLKKHGAKIIFKNVKKKNNEAIGDIYISSSKIRPIKATKEYYVNSTDEYPILFVIAALIKGTSVFKGVKDLANKESNRIKEMQKILKQLNVDSLFVKDDIKIFGKGLFSAKKKRILVPKLEDHRICMSSFILSILTGADTKIKNFETVNTSSPSFLKIMKLLGVNFEIQN